MPLFGLPADRCAKEVALDLKELKEILQILDEQDITEFELEEDGMKLRDPQARGPPLLAPRRWSPPRRRRAAARLRRPGRGAAPPPAAPPAAPAPRRVAARGRAA